MSLQELRMRFWHSRLWRARHRLGWWGYLAEAGVHVRGLFHRQHPSKRFVIFAQGRTGSRLLCDLLHGQPSIHCDREILHDSVRSPEGMIQGCARLSTCDTYGFKVKIDQLTEVQRVDDPRAFLLDMQTAGWRVIHLQRRNMLRHALSGLALRHAGQAHFSRTERARARWPMPVRREDLMQSLQRRKKLTLQEQKVLAGMDHMPLTYEDDLYDPDAQQQTLRRITDWLGLPFEPAKTDIIRSTPKRLTDLVENHDELVGWVRNTEFARFLGDPTT